MRENNGLKIFFYCMIIIVVIISIVMTIFIVMDNGDKKESKNIIKNEISSIEKENVENQENNKENKENKENNKQNKEHNNVNDDKDLEDERLETVTGKGIKHENRVIYKDENNKRAVIPQGYAVVKDSPNIKEGLIISDVENDNVNNIKEGNQFVWVPVEYPFLDVRDCKTEEDINMKLMEVTREGKFPMSLRISKDNYAGVMYKFNEVNEGTQISAQFYNYVVDNGEREPENLNDNSDYIINWTQNLYQEEFNEMIKRVIKDKGFWVGRFETSVNDLNIAQSKINKRTKTNTTWYDLYNIQKSLSNEKTKSHMIWGCQWDQIMFWLKDITNFIEKIGTKYFILDSTNMGNYLNTEIKIIETKKEREQEKIIKRKGEALRIRTGVFETKGIYDLAGNVWEWTMEANYTNSRTARGGDCSFDGKFYPASSKFSFKPTYNEEKIQNIGSRMVIY